MKEERRDPASSISIQLEGKTSPQSPRDVVVQPCTHMEELQRA